MLTYQLTTQGIDSDRVLYAYEVTFPAGHYLNDGVMVNYPESTTAIQKHAYQPLPDAPDDLDGQVISERIKIVYPELLDGCVDEPRYVWATTSRVMGRCLAQGEIIEA